MIKSIFKNFLIVLTLYVIIGFFYVIYTQANKIKAYESGNGKISELKLNLEYNSSSVKFNTSDSDTLTEFARCYQTATPTENFSEELQAKFNEIENYFRNSGNNISFTYEDLYSGLHLSYNESQNYFVASTIKSPVVTYIYEKYLNNEVDMNEVITYQPNHYLGGSGSIQNEPFGTDYTIHTLMTKAITESDNIAYQMLANRFYGNDIKNYWTNLGASTFWTNGTTWGQTNTHDMAIYMKRLYQFTKENSETTEELLNWHFNAVARFINIENRDLPIAHKSGWNYANVHDMAIVYNKQPYVLAITTLKGYDNYVRFFKDASTLINEFHELYWNQKSYYCYDTIFE